jgi:carbamoyltransferase
MKRKLILGIHASFTANTHDPSICLIDNGKIIFAAEEERFNRNKTSLGLLPHNAINNLLKNKNISIKDIDLVVSTGTTNIYIKKK